LTTFWTPNVVFLSQFFLRRVNCQSLSLLTRVQCESKNIPPWCFLTFSPNCWNFLSKFYMPISLYGLIYARLQNNIFIQLGLPATLTKLCHIKCNHPVHIICAEYSPSAETHSGWPHFIWHNFVTTSGVFYGIKFWQKIILHSFFRAIAYML